MNSHMKMSRGKEKLVSVLIPSRGRVDILKKSIKSIIKNVNKKEKVEVLIRFDYDDHESLSRINELPFQDIDIYIVIGERFRGYADLHYYINELCSISRGEFIFLFNDDSTIETKNWEDIIERYTGQIVVLNPSTRDTSEGNNTFPIVNRKIFENWGHFSLQTHNDTWIQIISRSLGIERTIKDLFIFHDRYCNTGNNKDVIWDERVESYSKGCRQEFDMPKYVELRRKDTIELLKMLRNK